MQRYILACTGLLLLLFMLYSLGPFRSSRFIDSSLVYNIDYHDSFSATKGFENVPTQDSSLFTQNMPSTVGSTNTRSDMVLVNAWVGSAMPSYFPQFIHCVQRNPSIFFLLVSTHETPEFCPTHGSQSIYFPPSNPRVKVHCSTPAELIANSSAALCSEWNCSQQEFEQVRKHFGDFVSIDGQAWNNLKPVYATIFADYIRDQFPGQSFSHWIRVDLDLFIGNWERLFPSETLQKYDVFTFFPGASMNWEYIYLKGYIAGFRLSHRVNTLWKTMGIFKDPAAFIRTFHDKSFTDPSLTMAADEGAQTVNTFRDHPEISFIVEPGLLAVDLDIAADREQKIVYYGSEPDILRVPVTAIGKEIERYRNEQAVSKAGPVLPLGPVYLTQECDMKWLQKRDRLCIQRPIDSHQLSALDDSNHQIRISRAPGSFSLEAYAHPSPPPPSDREIGSARHALFYHIQVTKKHGLNYTLAKPGDYVEISKDEESFWRLKRIDRYGEERFYKSEIPWPGLWE